MARRTWSGCWATVRLARGRCRRERRRLPFAHRVPALPGSGVDARLCSRDGACPAARGRARCSRSRTRRKYTSRPTEGPRLRWSALRGRWPRGQRHPAWVGSAVEPGRPARGRRRRRARGRAGCRAKAPSTASFARGASRRRGPSRPPCHWRIRSTDGGRWKPSRSICSKRAAVSQPRSAARFGSHQLNGVASGWKSATGPRGERIVVRGENGSRITSVPPGLEHASDAARARRQGRAGAAGSRR